MNPGRYFSYRFEINQYLKTN